MTLEVATVPSVEEVLADPAISAWLRAALEAAVQRDPIDALNDSLLLTEVLDQRLRERFDL